MSHLLERKNAILNNLKQIISKVYESDIHEINVASTFIEMGLDSISIIQVKQLVKNEYQLEIPVNRLFDDVSTLEKFAQFIDASLETSPVKHEKRHESLMESFKISETLFGEAGLPESTEIHEIISQQLQIMSKQIELLTR